MYTYSEAAWGTRCPAPCTELKSSDRVIPAGILPKYTLLGSSAIRVAKLKLFTLKSLPLRTDSHKHTMGNRRRLRQNRTDKTLDTR